MSNTDVTTMIVSNLPTSDPMPLVEPEDIYTMGLTGDDLTDAVASEPDRQFDPVTMIREIGKFNPAMANNLWYKLNNKPGSIKEVAGEKYIVSPKGSWIKASN